MDETGDNYEVGGLLVPKECINRLFIVESRNYLSVTNMLVHLGGHNAQFEFCSNPNLAVQIYKKGIEDMIELGTEHNIFFFERQKKESIEAQLCVVHYKRNKLS